MMNYFACKSVYKSGQDPSLAKSSKRTQALCVDCQLPEESVYGIAYDLVTALMFLHSKRIVYCDLKPANNLICALQLSDFGLARNPDDISKSLSTGICGAMCYMALELYDDGGVRSFASAAPKKISGVHIRCWKYIPNLAKTATATNSATPEVQAA